MDLEKLILNSVGITYEISQKMLIFIVANSKKQKAKQLLEKLLLNSILFSNNNIIYYIYINLKNKNNINDFINKVLQQNVKSFNIDDFSEICKILSSFRPDLLENIQTNLLENHRIHELIISIKNSNNKNKRKIFLLIVKKQKQNKELKYLLDNFVFAFPELKTYYTIF